MLHFGELLFPAVCSVKLVHYVFDASDEVAESFKLKHTVFFNRNQWFERQENLTSNLLVGCGW